jgi:hypothetical protein
MNLRLILALSMFGLAMAIGTVFFIPSSIEPALWLVIFLVCAVMIARRAPGRPFLHGLCTSLVNCVWITGAHVLFFETYAAGHAAEVAAMKGSRAMMLVVGPIIGVVSGLILGLFSVIATKVLGSGAAKPGTSAPSA